MQVTLEELKAPLAAECDLHITETGPVQALCGYFDVSFKGSEANPADNDVRLSTAPDATGATHWGQQCFFLSPPVEAEAGDSLHCALVVTRRAENQRLLDVTLEASLRGDSVAAQEAPPVRRAKYHID